MSEKVIAIAIVAGAVIVLVLSLVMACRILKYLEQRARTAALERLALAWLREQPQGSSVDVLKSALSLVFPSLDDMRKVLETVNNFAATTDATAENLKNAVARIDGAIEDLKRAATEARKS